MFNITKKCADRLSKNMDDLVEFTCSIKTTLYVKGQVYIRFDIQKDKCIL